MSDFERKYYENEAFWEDGALGDSDLKRIDRTIELLPGEIENLIDVGCGNGIFCNQLTAVKPDLKIIGLDRSKAALKHLKTESIAGEINKIPFPDNAFDCVTSLQVLEHLNVDIFPKALKELSRISRKYIVISVPFDEDVTRHYAKCPSCKSIFNWDFHLRTFSESQMVTLFDQLGFECIHHETLIKTKRYVGLDAYANFRKSKKLQFVSPICPVCGYAKPEKDKSDSTPSSGDSGKRSKPLFGKMISSLLKPIWPTVESPGYWIIGLYRKKSTKS